MLTTLLRDNGLPDLDEGMVLVQLDDGSVVRAGSLEEADRMILESRDCIARLETIPAVMDSKKQRQ